MNTGKFRGPRDVRFLPVPDDLRFVPTPPEKVFPVVTRNEAEG